MDIPRTKKIEPTLPEPSSELASWNRQRTIEELRQFVERHHDSRLDDIVLE